MSLSMKCPDCKGTGFHNQGLCANCNRTGGISTPSTQPNTRVPKEKELRQAQDILPILHELVTSEIKRQEEIKAGIIRRDGGRVMAEYAAAKKIIDMI